MERKIYELKDAAMGDTGNGSLEGYGAAYGNVDLGGDMLMEGSCKNIPEFIARGCLMVGHAWDSMGVATIDDARQDAKGLWFKATFHSDDCSQMARKVAQERMARSKFMGLSIGYSTLDSSTDTVDGTEVRKISGWNAYEISMVTTPMNPMAGATSAKSFEEDYDSALAAVRGFLTRAKGLKELREGDGRKLSPLNIQRITALAADTETLHSQLKGLLTVPPEMATSEQVEEMHRTMAAMLMAGVR